MNQQTIILNQSVNFSGTVCRGITGTLCAEYPANLMDAGKKFSAKLISKKWEGNWLQIVIEIYLND